MKAKIVARLVAEIDGMAPKLRVAAKYIVDRPVDFGLDPVRESAAKIGVSPNVLIRLAAHLGFDRFDELRAPFREALLSGGDAAEGHAWLKRMEQAGEPGRAQAEVARNELNIVNRSLRLMTPERVEAVVEAMRAARSTYVTATRASYALAYYFHYVGRMALPSLQLIPRHMGSPVDEMIDVDGRDLLFAITFPPYSSETIKALHAARARGAKVALLSDSELVGPNIVADYMLQVSAQSTHRFSCFAGAFAVLECLVAHLYRRGGEDVQARVTTYQSLREDTGAYWSARLPRIRGPSSS